MPIYTKINGEMKEIQAIKTKYNGELVNISNIMTKINGEMVSIFSSGWQQPTDWKEQNIDLRKTAPDNSIALLAGVKSDYSAYDNLGFVATCTGGYKVFIDGVQYGETYASATQCNITWSNYSATQGKSITTPENLIAHEIHIVPATENAEITEFHCARVADAGTERQGVLWIHFNLENICKTAVLIRNGIYGGWTYTNNLILAITAKNNLLTTNGNYNFSNLEGNKLEYLPKIKLSPSSAFLSGTFAGTQIKNVVISKDNAITCYSYSFTACHKLEKIKTNQIFNAVPDSTSVFQACYKLKKLPIIDYTSATLMPNFLTNAESLQDTILDVRSATGLKIIGCYGSTAHFMTGFKGLRVSNQAPFDSTSSPQINVSYTGMDRQALVQLFNDLPSVNDGQIININGCSGSELLSPSDLRIATNKGWSVIGGPAYKTYATFTGASIGNTIKLNDGMATSNYDYSAYPNDTTLTGEFTKTATATSVDEANNIIEIAQEPATTENDVIIKTGTIYQEYKDNNDNAVLSRGKLSGNFNLQNASVVGTLTNDNGLYNGFSGSDYISITDTITFNNNFKFIIKCTTDTLPRSSPLLSNPSNNLEFYIPSASKKLSFYDGTSHGGTNPLSNNTTYWLGLENDNGILKWYSDNGTHSEYNLNQVPDFTDTNFWRQESTYSKSINNNNWRIGAHSSRNYWGGSIDMTNTSITIDGVKTSFGYTELTSPLYDTNYEPIDITGATFSGDTITLNGIDYTKTGNEIVRDIDANIETYNSTTLNEVNIIYPDNATLKTETQLTSKSNIDLIGYKSVFASVPPDTNSVIESNGVQYSSGNILLKDNQPLTISIRDNSNNLLYINDMNSQRSIYPYQVISFNLPDGVSITSTINKGLPSSALSRYAYVGDVIDYETSTGTTGSYIVGYANTDGKETIINI